MSDAELDPRILCVFVEALSAETGSEALAAVLSKNGLPREWSQPSGFTKLDSAQAAIAYARMQAALRSYYGRGARGLLLRIGAKLWLVLLKDAPLSLRLKGSLIRLLPQSARFKPALRLLALLMGGSESRISIHNMDLDLLFVDRDSPAAAGRAEEGPICFVTLGLLRECLFWAAGREHDIEETACRAHGASQCEFKITIGG